ncbi:MAG: BREX-2 system adenine-specific DNA-methyltransferase PglX, partial [Pirellulaceae bacterium]
DPSASENPIPDPTRFLGDLYQDLSERARKKYALLQTPVFVEEFILDRTLDPAIDEFGLDTVRMIDPTCGSGHFLLGAFARLFDLWMKREDNEVVAAQKALHGVWGVDINPFAVAIARFRLIVAAIQACGMNRLKSAPGWNIHLATGDSLLFGNRWIRDGEKKAEQQFFRTEDESWAPEIYACEDKEAVSEVLGQQYHAVVGNPPYIIVRDRTLNQAYRARYSTCHQKYSLSVPFSERFFDLAITSTTGRAGFVGQITANSFMKREFGKKLVEQFFPRVDLTNVVDTSGVYISGHGTPTVILFGRNRTPSKSDVRAVMGIKGEPTTPDDPAMGKVWQSILQQIDCVDSEDDFVSTTDVPRSVFNTHPWNIGGGGASKLMKDIEDHSPHIVADLSDSIGITCFTLEDDVYILAKSVAMRFRIIQDNLRPMVVGDSLRDWAATVCDPAVFPYHADFSPISEDFDRPLFRYLWMYRTNLSNSKMFGGKTKVEAGLRWFEYGRLTHKKLRTPLSIAFAFVATHNHFVLDRGGKVFNRSAPIIKLKDDATEEDHLALLGLLNSSTACFWMKQTFHNKGSTVDQHGARQRTDLFEDFFEYTGTGLKRFPVPDQSPLPFAQRLNGLSESYVSTLPEGFTQREKPTAEKLIQAKSRSAEVRAQMIALQEELDWRCYQLYGLLEEDFVYTGDDLPKLELGERPFEIVMARQMEKGELETSWFERHGSKPVTDIPEHWPETYRQLVERRIELIQTNKAIGLIEKPEYKRRWNTEPWDSQQQRAVRNWLLDRLESKRYWPEAAQREPRLRSVAELADQASGDPELMEVGTLYRGRQDFDVTALVAELVESESVPVLPVLRYKASGLRKRAVWEQTWDLQRREDAGEEVGDIKVPPKYASKDFRKGGYWRLRGKLDVPKERWVSFPYCETESDPSLVVGWAGWDHLQQATAIVAYYDARKRQGWDAKRLTPLLAALDQLLPWIHQWHPEVDPEFGETAGQSFETVLEADAHELGLTLEGIRAWTPLAKKGNHE